MDIVGIVKSVYEMLQKLRADKRSAAATRVQARPYLVFVTASTNPSRFTLRNVGEPITKLMLLADDPTATISPTEHLDGKQECSITLGSRPTLPVTVRVEYKDKLGHADVIRIKLRLGAIEVLGFDSDKR